ncbi:hypothetical protein [Neisseria sp. Ec49-e6-T10]|uniref:hypothetical protein n=1 Tax=Neisseria sp. Ec49-e6-T10 TaxID=3140744 RepID=UPI003EB75D82
MVKQPWKGLDEYRQTPCWIRLRADVQLKSTDVQSNVQISCGWGYILVSVNGLNIG